MRRQEIVDGILQVEAALRGTKIPEALRMLMEVHNQPNDKLGRFSPALLQTFKDYLFRAQKYNAAAKKIAEIFKISVLEDPDFWADAAAGDVERTRQLFRNVNYAVEFLPPTGELVRSEASRLVSKQSIAQDKISDSVVTVILSEDAHHYSRPERIAEALLSITHLYEALATIESVAENTLIVLTCDSGSDKSFDLLGAAKVIAGVKELLLSVWDRVVFYREMKLAQRLDLVATSLPILDKLSELEKSQSVGPEQAELIRRKILTGVGEFLATGATIPEMTARSHVDPRELMATEPKLLTTGAEQPSGTSEKTDSKRRKRKHETRDE